MGFVRLCRALKPSSGPNVGALPGSHDWAEEDFNLEMSCILVGNLDHLVKSLLAERRFALFEGSVLALDNGTAHRALALHVALHAGCEGHIKNQKSRWDLVPLGQIEQIFASLGGERRRVNHAEAVRREALLYDKMYQRKGLGVEALITLVVADVGTRPIRGYDLGGPKVSLGECGFPASRRAA
jgi:hypothetical protein